MLLLRGVGRAGGLLRRSGKIAAAFGNILLPKMLSWSMLGNTFISLFVISDIHCEQSELRETTA